MDIQKVTAEYRLSQWAQVMQAQQASGQNIKDFCQTTGISRNAYFYWQKKLRKVACRELTQTSEPRDIVPSGWMQLKPNQTQLTTDGLCIEINDYHITVNAQTDLELLKKVCLTLRSLG
mgnify:FL=1|jgi:putative transposase